MNRGALLLLICGLPACQPEELPVTTPQLMPVESPFEYPVELWDRGVEGEALLLLRVTREGGVDSVKISNTSGQPALDSAAVAGARKLQFVPGRLGDRPVDMWTKVPVRFSRDSTALR